MEKYIAIDLKSYYASVECAARGLDPLSANLLVADESRTDKTIVLAVSPALKALGVPGRPRLFEAKRAIGLAEQRLGHSIKYIIAPPRMAEYIKISSDIYGIYLNFAAPEDIHVYSIDECFIYATPYLHFYPQDGRNSPAHCMTMNMIRAVLAETNITATAGIGSNLYLAKIAMDIVAKKSPPDSDGVRIAELDERTYRELLWDHRPITDFWQISLGTKNRLKKYGMYTMGDIAAMSLVDEERLYKIFGINAELIIDHAWGIEPCTMRDIKNYHADSHSLSTGQVLPRPYKFPEACIVFSEMADRLAYDMLKQDVVSDHFSFWASFDPKSLEETVYTGPVNIDHYGRLVPRHISATVRLNSKTSSARIIIPALKASFEKKVDSRLLVRRMGISAEEIEPSCSFHQMDLFNDLESAKRDRALQLAMLKIRYKYGENSLIRGMNMLEGATAIERNAQIGGHRA